MIRYVIQLSHTYFEPNQFKTKDSEFFNKYEMKKKRLKYFIQKLLTKIIHKEQEKDKS